MLSPKRNFWRRLWVRFLSSPAGSSTLRRIGQPIDRFLLTRSRGRLSLGVLLGIYPTLLLTTIGARSGRSRITPLIYMRDGAQIVLVASNFGSPNHPAWYHNLRANPQVWVAAAGHRGSYYAREAAGAERLDLWERAIAFYPGYADYQARADGRPIPIIILEPAG